MYRYAVTANRLITEGSRFRLNEWSAIRQIPTFFVEASSMGEAAAKADEILGEYHAPSLCVVEI